jgi:hypothetical protein
VNGTEPSFKGLPGPEIADMERVLDEIQVLLPVLGFDVLRPAGQETLAAKSARQLQASNDLSSPSESDVFTFTESGLPPARVKSAMNLLFWKVPWHGRMKRRVVRKASTAAVSN